MDKSEKLKRIHEIEKEIKELQELQIKLEERRSSCLYFSAKNGYEKEIPNDLAPMSHEDYLFMVRIKVEKKIGELKVELESLIS